jgi:S-adenosylmethionine-diacylgycerolhomoserine-N-methlytransferase
MYRLQRHFYDATRKFYLLGRDRLLREIDVRPGESILEVGCGTARNLLILARRHPDARFFGIDASAAMLETARDKIVAAGQEKNIVLALALADEFAYDRDLQQQAPFDKIFFSFSLSMIPPWRESIENALANLAPKGELHIVDFFDQAEISTIVRRPLKAWLRLFGVVHPPELLDFLKSSATSRNLSISCTPLYRRYSILVSLTR